MLAFGGNGPVHAATLARLLDIRKILVPPAPGLFSAWGCCSRTMEHHYVRTLQARLDALELPGLDAVFRSMEADGAAVLAAEGFAAATHRCERWSTCATRRRTPS